MSGQTSVTGSSLTYSFAFAQRAPSFAVSSCLCLTALSSIPKALQMDPFVHQSLMVLDPLILITCQFGDAGLPPRAPCFGIFHFCSSHRCRSCSWTLPPSSRIRRVGLRAGADALATLASMLGFDTQQSF